VVCQGIIVLTVAELLNAITPPQQHMHFDGSSNAGAPPINTVGAPGIQGATVIGKQGMGVNAPSAAAVAAATIGLPNELHVPNGRILTMGM